MSAPEACPVAEKPLAWTAFSESSSWTGVWCKTREGAQERVDEFKRRWPKTGPYRVVPLYAQPASATAEGGGGVDRLLEALAFYASGRPNAFRCGSESIDLAKGTGPCCERVIDAGGIARDALARWAASGETPAARSNRSEPSPGAHPRSKDHTTPASAAGRDVAVEKARQAFYEAARATWDARRASQRVEAGGCSPKQSDDAWALACACGEKERAAYDALLAAEAAERGEKEA